ncbi:GNAT family N-acetyltransferase [Arthrobacter sp. ISL-69]|uniref:GNAT family N-acetyltransferase n=1 Tax=Arthrobacter sp. ISL-69 TaxID=2819113 RepID=UPI001BECF364|nr:GNAT family N-acetyltransferase [Arthrobacter sp. ISL-69]MBT2535603.1 GNAT family N-acetyltransferase [Arthrobacter sp. ISL-69]
MSPSDHTLLANHVQLLDVTAGILEELLAVALADAAPDDVTPPLGENDGWNPERIGWFRDYHRAAAAGLDGPAAQKTWAISCNGQIAGSIRLKRPGAAPAEGGPLETGLWLGRSFRGRGIGREALTLVRAVASRAGASMLQAETTAENAAAQALLRSAGAELAGDGVSSPVTARISLR